MNNKFLSVLLVAGIATTGFAGITAANSGNLLNSDTQMQQTVKNTSKAQFGKRKGLKNLTEEEKTALESMTDEEKQAFFEAKKSEMQAEKELKKAVVDKLIAGETLSADEETLRLEMLAKIEDDTHPRRDGGDIIAKILAGDELTADEQTELAQMQEMHAAREAEKAKVDAMSDTEKEAYFAAKKSEMKAQKEAMKPLLEKAKNGETLTADEQAQLDEFKSNAPIMKEGKGKGHEPRGGKHGHKGDDDDRETN